MPTNHVRRKSHIEENRAHLFFFVKTPKRDSFLSTIHLEDAEIEFYLQAQFKQNKNDRHCIYLRFKLEGPCLLFRPSIRKQLLPTLASTSEVPRGALRHIALLSHSLRFCPLSCSCFLVLRVSVSASVSTRLFLSETLSLFVTVFCFRPTMVQITLNNLLKVPMTCPKSVTFLFLFFFIFFVFSFLANKASREGLGGLYSVRFP